MNEVSPDIVQTECQWADELVHRLDDYGTCDSDDFPTGIGVMTRLPEPTIRRLTHWLGQARGLHGIHDFIKIALFNPGSLAREIQDETGTRFTRKYRDRLEVTGRGFAFGMIRTYRMQSYFHGLVQLFFNQGENDIGLVADFLAHLSGPEAAIHKLYKKLSSRDPELREYVLYILAELAEYPQFDSYSDRLYSCYEQEQNGFVIEAYEYLFDFGGGS